jgi:putative transposase
VARILRTQLPDGFFHVHTLGVADTAVYRDDEDRRSWLQIFRSAVRRYRWEIHALCLMTTHYHLVLESKCEQLSNGMQWLNSY